MTSYLVTYQQYIDADTPEQAAQEAYDVLREPETWDIPPTLGVMNLDAGDQEITDIDLVPANSPLGRLLHPNRAEGK